MNTGTDPCNLIVNYIPTPVTDEVLRQLFEPFGEVATARVIVDKNSNHPKGYGFVKFVDPECAKVAMDKMNGFELQNKRLKVTPAKGPTASVGLPNSNGSSNPTSGNVAANPTAVPNAANAAMMPNAMSMMNPAMMGMPGMNPMMMNPMLMNPMMNPMMMNPMMNPMMMGNKGAAFPNPMMGAPGMMGMNPMMQQQMLLNSMAMGNPMMGMYSGNSMAGNIATPPASGNMLSGNLMNMGMGGAMPSMPAGDSLVSGNGATLPTFPMTSNAANHNGTFGGASTQMQGSYLGVSGLGSGQGSPTASFDAKSTR